MADIGNSAKLNETVSSNQIVDGTIATADLANDAVDADKLASDAVVNASVASDAAIATSKLSGALTAVTSSGLGTAAARAAEDTMTDGANLPDGAAIKAYGDTNWAGGGASDIDGLSDAVSGITNFTNSLILGHQTTGTLSSADQNTAVGYAAMDAITSGDDNTIMGYNAGSAVTSASDNVILGSGAGVTTTDVDGAVIIGQGAGAADMTSDADGTILIGYGAGAALTSGRYNTAIGYQAFSTENALGDKNVAIGYQTLLSMDADTDGHGGNTCIGYQAGWGITTGTNNTFIGNGAGDSSAGTAAVAGDANVGIGVGACRDLTSGYTNIAMGEDALANCTEGFSNTAIGHRAGSIIETGVRNTLIGSTTSMDDSTRNDVVCVGVGIGGDSGTINLGTSSTSKIWVDNDSTSWANASDERIKKDIEDCDLGLAFINDLRPVTFKWRAYEDWDEELKEEPTVFVNADGEEETIEMTKPGINTEKLNYGFVAQEVKATMESHNHPKFPAWGYSNRKTGEQSLSKGNFITPLINAVQELSEKNDELAAKVEALENA